MKVTELVVLSNRGVLGFMVVRQYVFLINGIYSRLSEESNYLFKYYAFLASNNEGRFERFSNLSD